MGILSTFLIAILCQQVLSSYPNRRPSRFKPSVRNGFQPTDLENGLQINDQKSSPVTRCLQNILMDPIIRKLLENLNYCSYPSQKLPITGENGHEIPISPIPKELDPKPEGVSGSPFDRRNSMEFSDESEENSLEHTSQLPAIYRHSIPGSKSSPKVWIEGDSEEESAEPTPNPRKYQVPKKAKKPPRDQNELDSEEENAEQTPNPWKYQVPKKGKKTPRNWDDVKSEEEIAEPTPNPWKYQVPKKGKSKKIPRNRDELDSEDVNAEQTTIPWKFQVPKKVTTTPVNWEEFYSEEESAEPTPSPRKYQVPKVVALEPEESDEELQSRLPKGETPSEKIEESESDSEESSEENDNISSTSSESEELITLKPKIEGPSSFPKTRIDSVISSEGTTIAPITSPINFTEKEVISKGHPEMPIYPVGPVEEPGMDIKKELEEFVEHGNDENDPDCTPLIQAIRDQLQNLNVKQQVPKITINTAPVARSLFGSPSMGRKSQRNGEYGSGTKTLEGKLSSSRHRKGGGITHRRLIVDSKERIENERLIKPSGLRWRLLEHPELVPEPEEQDKKTVYFGGPRLKKMKSITLPEEIPEEKRTVRIRGHKLRKIKLGPLLPQIVPENKKTVHLEGHRLRKMENPYIPELKWSESNVHVPVTRMFPFKHFQEKHIHNFAKPGNVLEKHSKRFQVPEGRFLSIHPFSNWKERIGNIANMFLDKNVPLEKDSKLFQVPKA